MRILVALGGNALLKRGEPPTTDRQRANIRRAAAQLARLAPCNDLIVTHGNGPQVGLLALEAAALTEVVGATPLDVLDAESEGMIGYLIEQELANALPPGRAIATLLTRVEIRADDPALRAPTKPVGPVYSHADAQRVAAERGWSIAEDGAGWRRVVGSPAPQAIVGLDPVR